MVFSVTLLFFSQGVQRTGADAVLLDKRILTDTLAPQRLPQRVKHDHGLTSLYDSIQG